MSRNRLEWYHWHAWAAVLQAIVGAPLWWKIYVAGVSREAVTNRLSEIALGLPDPLPGVVFASLLFGIIGPVLFAARSAYELWVRDVEFDVWWLALAVISIQFWPLQFVAVWWHRQDCMRVENRENAEWRVEVSQL